jgi:hypothetical protein
MKKSKALHLLSVMASVTLPSLLPGSDIDQVRFLIGNGKAESFELKIEKIWLQ